MNAETLKVIITAEADKMKAELEKAKGYIESFEGKTKSSLEQVDSQMKKSTDANKVKANMDKATSHVKQFSEKSKVAIKKVGDSLDKISGGRVKSQMAKAEGAVEKFASKAKASIAKVDDAFSKLGGGKVKEAFSKASSAASGFASKASGAIAGVASAFSGIAAAAGVAFAAVTAAATAAFAKISSALTGIEEQSREYRRELARVETAFQMVGGTSEDAEEALNGLFAITGDLGTASEAAGHLSRLSTSIDDLREKTIALQGVYAMFPNNAIDIGGLTDSIAETIVAGKVVGTLADALNWVGYNEDLFNEQLAQCNGTLERSNLIWGVLNQNYYEAGLLYAQNAEGVMAVQAAQSRLDSTMGELGDKIAPMKVAFLNLANAALVTLAPAIEVVANLLAGLANAAASAINAIAGFVNRIAGREILPTIGSISDAIGGLTGATSQFTSGINGASEAASGLSGVVSAVGDGVSGAARGARDLARGFRSATREANQLKRTTQGFDELIKAKAKETNEETPSTPSTGGSGGSGGSGVGGSGFTGGDVDYNVNVNGAEEAESIFEKLGRKIRSVYDEYIAPFVEDIKAIGKMIYNAIEPYIQPIINAFKKIGTGIGNVLGGSIKVIQGAFRIITGFLTGDTDKVYDGFDTMTEGFTQIGEGAVGAVGGVADLVKSITEMNAGLGGTIFSNIGSVFGDLFEDLSEKWENSKIGQFFKTLTTGAIASLGVTITELPGSMLDKIKDAWDTIKDKGATLKASFLDATSGIREKLSGAWDTIVTTTRKLTGKFSNPDFKIGDKLKGLWKTIKTTTRRLTGKFSNPTYSIGNKLKSLWSSITTKTSTLTARFRDFFSSAIRRAWNGIASGINSAIGIINRIPGVNIGRVPYLATGGITKGSTLAHIGEGGYKEAVLPLERNTGWMNTLADKIAERGGAGGASTIVLQIDGRELGRAAINSINDITHQSGSLQLVLM